MSDLILISILSNLKTFFIIICIALVLIVIFLWGMAFDENLSENEADSRKAKNKVARLTILTVICLVLATLLPNKKEVYMIYGFGSVIDYVDNNETAKELPDKIVDIVDDYLTKQDSILKLNRNESNKN